MAVETREPVCVVELKEWSNSDWLSWTDGLLISQCNIEHGECFEKLKTHFIVFLVIFPLGLVYFCRLTLCKPLA